MAAAKKKAFCTITIPDIETAAVVCAQLYPSANEILGEKNIRNIIYEGVCGGEAGYRAITKKVEPKLEKIWQKIDAELEVAGADRSSQDPPWLRNVPPAKLGGHLVMYHGKKGVSVGCVNASLRELELIVKECKKKK